MGKGVSDMPVGMYLSRCRGALDAVLDLPGLAAGFADSAAVCRVVDDFFSVSDRATILADIAEHSLGGIVLAGNSPEHYLRSLSAPELRQTLVAAGVNPNRIAFANLLEQVGLPHADDAAGANAKASALLAEALRRATSFPSIAPIETAPLHTVLVLGGTAGGIVAAQHLLRSGYEVVVVDAGTLGDESLEHAGGLSATVAYVSGHRDATIIENASLADGEGWVGDYRLVLDTPEGAHTIRVGGMIIADGAAWLEPLRRHYALAVDDEGMPLPTSPAHPASTGDPGIAMLPAFDDGIASCVQAADSAVLTVMMELVAPETLRYGATSSVDEALCGGCASCVKTCAFGACSIDPERGISHVDPRRCHGCGKCVVSCPVGARDLVSSPHAHMLETIVSMSSAEVSGARVLGFLCGGCGYPAADNAGRLAAAGGDTYPASFLPIRIPCGGRLDALYVLEAFRRGFDGVAVFRCREGHCKNLVGNLDMDRRINLLRTVLRSRAIDDARLRIIDISPGEGALFTEEVNAFFGDLGGTATAEGGPR